MKIKGKHSRWLLIPISLLIQTTSFPQNENIAIHILRLEKELENSPVNKKVDLLNLLSAEYLTINPEKARVYAENALQLARMVENHEGKSRALYNLGKAQFSLFEYDSAVKNYQLAREFEISRGNDSLVSDLSYLMGKAYFEINDYNAALNYILKSIEAEQKFNRPQKMISCIQFLGSVYYALGNYQSSLVSYKRAADIAQNVNNIQDLADISNRMGIVYNDLGSFEKALEYYLKSLKLVEELQDKQGIARTLNNIGIVYYEWGNKEKALEFYQKSLKMEEELGNRLGIGDSYNNIGIVYGDWDQNELAIKYYGNAIEIYEEFRDNEGTADVMNNLGESYFAMGNYEKAFEYLTKSLEIEKKLGNKYGMAQSYHTLGSSYFELSDLNKAIEFNLKSFAISDSLNLSALLVDNYDLFYKIYEKKKNYALALENFRNYSRQKDTIYNRQFHNNLAEIQAKYEIARFDKERELMTQDAVVKGKEIRTQRTYLIIIFILMLVFGILVYYDIRSKMKANTRLNNINEDLTGQKEKLTRTLEALSKSEAKYKNLVENSPTGIIYIDNDGNILEVNKKILEILGSPGEDATKEINCLTYPLLRKVGLSDAIIKSIETGEVVFNETFYTSAWGKKVFLRYYITPVANKNDKITNLIINVEDVTLSKEAELIKIQSESKYRVLVENSLQAMLIIQEGKLIFANSRMEELTQYKFVELANKQDNWIKSLIHQEDYERVIKNIELATKKKKSPARNEYKYVRKDGTIRWIETLGSIVDYYEKPAILVVAIDITERKQGESVLVESAQQLRQANAMKDKFFSIIAHDLKNPFSVILGFSHLLYEAYDNFDEKQRKSFIKNICEASENTFKLLQNLLEWSKTQTGKIQFSPAYINIHELTEENISVLKTTIVDKKIKVINKIDEESTAWADANMVKTILRNLLTNALKFTQPGGKVEISAINSEKYIEINVSDTGIGIEPENCQRLFRIDEQYKTTGTNNEEGSGLGLILCSEFVEKNNGKIWVESTIGKGSSFKFTLPIKNSLLSSDPVS